LKKKIIINKKSNLAYIPEDMIKSGYIGEVEAIANAVTVVLIKPGTDLVSVRRSLEITLQDIDLRMSQGEIK
jgi:hypothetical protein